MVGATCLCNSGISSRYGVCLQGTGDTTAQLGLDRVPKRAGCQESGIALQRSGASSYSVYLHEPE